MYVPVTVQVSGYILVDTADDSEAFDIAQDALRGLVDTQRGYGRLDLSLIDMKTQVTSLGHPRTAEEM